MLGIVENHESVALVMNTNDGTSNRNIRPCRMMHVKVVQWAERSDVICVIRHFECQKQLYGCAVGSPML